LSTGSQLIEAFAEVVKARVQEGHQLLEYVFELVYAAPPADPPARDVTIPR